MSLTHFLTFLLIGGLAGWLTGLITKGRGFGFAGNIIVGIVGAFLARFVFGLLRHRRLQFHRPTALRPRGLDRVCLVAPFRAPLITSLAATTTPRPALFPFPMTPLLRLITAVILTSSAAAATPPPSADWPAYLGNSHRNLYSPLDQINRSNVAQLQVAWTYDTGEKGEYQANNLIVAG
eukprot:gene47889-64952_t